MSVPHRINLRGPYQVLNGDDSGDPPDRIKLPNPWRVGFGDRSDSVTLVRDFGCPTNLSETTRLWLVFDGVGGIGTVSLNDRSLGEVTTDGANRFEITGQLDQRNRLTITFAPATDLDPDRTGLWGLIGLEIVEAG